MVHTLPPWTSKWRMATIFGQIDQGELAARLGSIDTFDRRGDVINIDDFEASTLKWGEVKDGDNSAVALNTLYARSGNNSVKCTTGNKTGDYAGIRKLLPYSVLSKFGFELSFTPTTLIDYYDMQIRVYTGAKLLYGDLHLDVVDDRIQIYKNPAGWKTVKDSFAPHVVGGLFHTVKLVADFEAEKWTRIIFNEETIDVSGYDLASTVATDVDAHIYAQFRHYTATDSTRSCYYDDAIITQNEH